MSSRRDFVGDVAAGLVAALAAHPQPLIAAPGGPDVGPPGEKGSLEWYLRLLDYWGKPPEAARRCYQAAFKVLAAKPDASYAGLAANEDTRGRLVLQAASYTPAVKQTIRVHFGGPVESGRGFVLHSSDFRDAGTTPVPGGLALTATIDILKSIAAGTGPRRSLLALGYAGWGPRQLDGELQANAWLSAPADEDIVFDADLDTKWERAMAKIGITPRQLMGLSGDAGHA